MPEDNSEYQIESDFIAKRRKENSEVSKIADNDGLLGKNASVSNASKFASKTRQTSPEMLSHVFKASGLIKNEK